jgi:hypothetical protein
MLDYQEFIRGKRIYVEDRGIDGPCSSMNQAMKEFQSESTRYVLKKGRGALFFAPGLGKTICQLEWAKHVIQNANGNVLGLCPLAVAPQTDREFHRFGIGGGRFPIKICESQDDVGFDQGIVLTNYEKLHKFDSSKFVGVFGDELSCIKSYTGKLKRQMCSSFAETPFKLSCTATPAPNDVLELGQQAEFLGVMRSNEMISRWFINDSMQAGKYRLRNHAREDYWDWVSSWAVSIEMPSDLGYSDEGYILPPIQIIEHEIEFESEPDDGRLFGNATINATSIHREKRQSNAARAEEVAGLVNGNSEKWIVWCDTDYESDELKRRIRDAVEVKGSHPEQKKIRDIDAFSTGQSRVIITKPSICGFGLNWFHCHNVAFAGVSYSFEQFYQALCRVYRFGQVHPVNIHVCFSPIERAIWNVVKSKELEHRTMKRSMSAAMRASQMEKVRGTLRLSTSSGSRKMELPSWI